MPRHFECGRPGRTGVRRECPEFELQLPFLIKETEI
uniref:T-complex polypeptide 1 n=1 Tax=Rhizophora mucronata TaxID=61149 RepID=A0A2P2MYQ4_RHIMU